MGVLVLGLVWVALRQLRSPGDYKGFVAFGHAVLDGVLPYSRRLESLYQPAFHSAWATWPPAFAPFAAGLALVDGVSRSLGVLLVQAASLAGLAATLVIFARGAEAGPADHRPESGGQRPRPSCRVPLGALLVTTPVLLAVVVPYGALLANVQTTQVNLLVLGLAATAFWLLHSGHRWAGGLTLGACTAFKATPLLLVAYLAWRGRWRDLGATAVGLAVWWIALPALAVAVGRRTGTPPAVGLASATTGLGSLAAWLGHTIGGGFLSRGSNQSLLSALLRSLPVERSLGLLVFAGVTAALAVLTLATFGRPFRPVGVGRETAEVAIVLVAGTLVSPLSWKAHYVTLVPLVLVLAAAGEGGGTHGAARPGRGLTMVLLGLVFASLALTGRDLVGRDLSVAAERLGLVTYAALALYLRALWTLDRPSRPRTLSARRRPEAEARTREISRSP